VSHHCHAIGCHATVPPKLFACGRHWRMVPRDLQAALWMVYRDGQEIDKRPLAAYFVVQTLCRIAIAGAEGRTGAVFEMVSGDLGCFLAALPEAQKVLISADILDGARRLVAATRPTRDSFLARLRA
jgi:hypothetical protein